MNDIANSALHEGLKLYLYRDLANIVGEYAAEEDQINRLSEVQILAPSFATERNIEALNERFIAMLKLLPESQEELDTLETKFAGSNPLSYERIAALADLTAKQCILHASPTSSFSPGANRIAKIVAVISFILLVGVVLAGVFFTAGLFACIALPALCFLGSSIFSYVTNDAAALERLAGAPLEDIRSRLISQYADKVATARNELNEAYTTLQANMSKKKTLNKNLLGLPDRIAGHLRHWELAEASQILDEPTLKDPIALSTSAEKKQVEDLVESAKSKISIFNEESELQKSLRNYFKQLQELFKSQEPKENLIQEIRKFSYSLPPVPPDLGVEVEFLLEKIEQLVEASAQDPICLSEAIGLLGAPLEKLLQSIPIYREEDYDQTDREALKDLKKSLMKIRDTEPKLAADGNDLQLADILQRLRPERKDPIQDLLKKIREKLAQNEEESKTRREAIRLLGKSLTTFFHPLKKVSKIDEIQSLVQKAILKVRQALNREIEEKLLGSESLKPPFLEDKRLFLQSNSDLNRSIKSLKNKIEIAKSFFRQGDDQNGHNRLANLDGSLQVLLADLDQQIEALRALGAPHH